MQGRLVMGLALLVLAVASPALAQGASISGIVTDESGAVLPGAAVTIVSEDQGFQRETTTNDRGYFAVLFLQPGRYALTVRLDGFAPVEVPEIVLNVGDDQTLALQMPVAKIGELVIVRGRAGRARSSPEVNTVVDRQFVENLPLNGRSFNALLELTPGMVVTGTRFDSQGQFSVNGQRSNTNYYMVDGVSANISIRGATTVSHEFAGSLPGLTTFGGTSNLVSVDALEEFKVLTSSYAPEYGRTPGAQISIATRSGTSRFHGSVFDYFRDDALDANDWFQNRNGLGKPPMRQHDFGGVLGGPLRRNRMFFFASYEGLRLRQPKVQVSEVPSLTARASAPPQMRPFLDAYPLPNGPDLTNGRAQFAAAWSDPSNLDATSLRIDYRSSDRLTTFGRYNHAPSETIVRGQSNSLNTVAPTQFQTDTLTGGATFTVGARMTGDVRANWSRNHATRFLDIDGFGGATPPPDSLLYPAAALGRDNSIFIMSMSGVTNSAILRGITGNNVQRQFNIVGTLAMVRGSHTLKFGVDYRRLFPTFDPVKYTHTITFAGVAGAVSGVAATAMIAGSEDARHPRFTNASLFAQDVWQTGHRLTLTYGARWEYNPPPVDANGNDAYTVEGLDDPATLRLAPQGTPLWNASVGNIAPRVGFSYLLSDRRQTVLRGGTGIFYDMGNGQGGAGYASVFPFISRKTLTNVAYPLTSANATPLPFSLDPPYGVVYAFEPDLELPYSAQWNLAVEQELGAMQSVTASYVGAIGRRLLREELLFNPNPSFTQVNVARDVGSSDYHALQLQYSRRLHRGLQVLASYTLSKSLDNVSDDAVRNAPASRLDIERERGPSTFDARHTFTSAVTWNVPAPEWGRAARAVMEGWSLDTMLRARSALPVNVVTGTDVLRIGLTGGSSVSRPDTVADVAPYVDDSSAPGGRRLNRAAFTIPLDRQGSLGRNALRGFPARQVDLTVRREFGLTHGFTMQFGTDLFNVFNIPNFGDPIADMASGLFGQSTVMLARRLGSGGNDGGFNPLYQIGGPRSIQLWLKVKY
jgi:hypothetical protein